MGRPTAKAKPVGMPKTTPAQAKEKTTQLPSYSATDFFRTPGLQPIYRGY
jgi:hypothetical protein